MWWTNTYVSYRYVQKVSYTYRTTKLGQNIVCTSCGCIYYDIMEFEIVLPFYNPLHHLYVLENINIPFDLSYGINILDQNNVLIDIKFMYLIINSSRTVSPLKQLQTSDRLNLFLKHSNI